MIPADIREEQACACLEAAEKYRDLLLTLARRLAGSDEGGMDLFQQTCLNCHDAVQRNGFAGDRYQFYLRTALINLHRKGQRKQQKRRTEPLTEEMEASTPEPATDGVAYLAEQMMREARATFSDADRVLLRMHLDGCTTREIAQALGKGDHTSLWRRLDKMKDYLRDTFQQAWDSLSE